MKITLCLLLAYLLGSLSPAALISAVKKTDLRKSGTKNLGATNTMLILGKRFGAAVMVFDIFKAVLATWCARRIAPELDWLAMAAGLFVIIGHCFPFYLRFRGGKGLAAFAGVVLAQNPTLFLFLLVSGVGLMILVNHSFTLPLYATVVFALSVALRDASPLTVAFACALSALTLVMHLGNLLKAIHGCDFDIRGYLGQMLSKRQKDSGRDPKKK